MAKFDITAAFAAAVGNVSDSDTSREAIEYIGLDKLEADPGNFYSLTGLEDLAANIELCGLQQPIRVRSTEDGRYVIVSGHRRWSALKLLRSTEGSGDRWASIPCIVERDEASQELRELRLIMGNRDTRKLSPAEVSKQAQRVELLLYQLKEQGYEFPGRMRDQVGAACQVSAPKLARLKVIREHLIPIYLEHFDRNELSEQTAYALARMETALQERLANMSSNILLLTKLENQQIVTNKTEYRLDEQLRSCILLLEKQWSAKEIDLSLNLDEVTFTGDEEMMSHIWVNLINNAIKFSPVGSVLELSCVRRERQIEVVVRDHGEGMSPETQKRIFEKFYQGDSAHATEGNGLGLSLVKRIVDLCGGRIEVASELGKGTAFTVYLPA